MPVVMTTTVFVLMRIKGKEHWTKFIYSTTMYRGALLEVGLYIRGRLLGRWEYLACREERLIETTCCCFVSTFLLPFSLSLYDIERRAFMSSTTFPAASLRDYVRVIVQTATQQWPQQQSSLCAVHYGLNVSSIQWEKKNENSTRDSPRTIHPRCVLYVG